MSHLPGCPCNSSHYAHCECDAIDLREHTSALERLATETSAAAQAASTAHHELIEVFAPKDQLATVRADLAAFFALLDIEEESDNGRPFHPTHISCCRAKTVPKLNELLTRLKAFASP